MKFLLELWRGEKSLVFTFWLMGVGASLFLTGGLIYSIATALNGGMIDLEWALLINAIYLPYILVAIWRSAAAYSSSNVKGADFGLFAKVVVVIVTGYIVFFIYAVTFL